MGSLQSPSSSSGHYRCDIKDPKSKSWFRTNDNTKPIQIEEEDVSKQGYIVLLTKIEWNSKSLYNEDYKNEREDTSNIKQYRSSSWRHSIKLLCLQRLSQCTGGAAEGMLRYRFQYINRSRSRTSKIKCMHFQRLSQCTGGAAEDVYSTILVVAKGSASVLVGLRLIIRV